MTKRAQLPLVAICGRPNVGKSTLYNRLTGFQTAIVHDEEGITRDRHYGIARYGDYVFRLVDTGGIVESPDDPVIQKMQTQVRLALNEADVIIFLVDGQQEITRVDEELREELFRYNKPVVLAVNKLDNPKMEINRHEFHSLGMGEPHAISSGHGIGVSELLDAVTANLPTPKEGQAAEELPEDNVTKVAIVGKPNVGKSSFVNAILNEERTIVDARPGTTRDAIDVEFRHNDRDYLLIDTAGMRKKAGIKAGVEKFSVSRSLRSINRADVTLLMIDATEGVTEQDQRIVGYAREHGSPIVLVWTKWDLIEDREAKFKKLPIDIDRHFPHMKHVPYITISNVARQRIFDVFKVVDEIAAQAKLRISTGELNRFLEKLKGVPASQRKGSFAKIRYATQTSVKPTTFVLFVNQKKLFHFSFLRHIENQLREQFGFKGVPIKIELREGGAKP